MTNLYRCRINKNMTQRKLSELSGVAISTIRNFEQDQRTIEKATLPVLLALAEVLSVPIYKLLDDMDIANRLYRIEKSERFLI